MAEAEEVGWCGFVRAYLALVARVGTWLSLQCGAPE
jgi:hypothetical protein